MKKKNPSEEKKKKRQQGVVRTSCRAGLRRRPVDAHARKLLARVTHFRSRSASRDPVTRAASAQASAASDSARILRHDARKCVRVIVRA